MPSRFTKFLLFSATLFPPQINLHVDQSSVWKLKNSIGYNSDIWPPWPSCPHRTAVNQMVFYRRHLFYFPDTISIRTHKNLIDYLQVAKSSHQFYDVPENKWQVKCSSLPCQHWLSSLCGTFFTLLHIIDYIHLIKQRKISPNHFTTWKSYDWWICLSMITVMFDALLHSWKLNPPRSHLLVCSAS